jgi:MATE family multidrug resistance protein
LRLLPKNYYLENAKLAFPVILSLAGQAVVHIADSMMTGRLGATQLAAVSLSGVIVMNIIVMGIGLSVGLTPLAGSNWATGKFRNVSHYFQNSLLLNFSASILMTMFLMAILPFLHHMGQPREVLQITNGYYTLITLSLIPLMVFLSFKQVLEALGNTRISMNITLTSVVINIVLNYLLIFGVAGFPRMGIEGAGMATLISRLYLPVAALVSVTRRKKYKRYFSFFGAKYFSLAKLKELVKTGLPISGQMSLEFFSLSFITIMMGWLGTKELAANQIVQTLINFTFMISNGIAAASTVLTSHRYGMRDKQGIRRYGFAGIHMAVVTMIFAAVIFLLLGEEIASLFSNDPEVIAISTTLFVVVAFFEVFDGIQVTALGALRGIMDVKRAMLYAIISYTFISLPFAYIMGFIFNAGAPGLLSGFAIGLLSASLLFTTRFHKKTSDSHLLFINLKHEN